MKRVQTLQTIQEVSHFIGKLKRRFPAANLGPIANLLSGVNEKSASLRYAITLSEGDSEILFSFDLNSCFPTAADNGAFGSKVLTCNLEFLWKTMAGHEVQIEGEFESDLLMDDNTQSPQVINGEFCVSFGEDKSECFYPIVEALLTEKDPWWLAPSNRRPGLDADAVAVVEDDEHEGEDDEDDEITM